MRNRCCYWANLPANSSGECAALDKLAEGEELGSNLLQVCLRSPASNYASGIPALATKHTYELIFGAPRLRSNRRSPGDTVQPETAITKQVRFAPSSGRSSAIL
jgi:hypothetical protein